MTRLLIIATTITMLATLSSFGSGSSLAVSVPLNHFYLVVDSATYSDIEKNEFLRNEFAAYEQRTTVRADRTYTGVYFYGDSTYFEFFDAAKETQRRVGDSGLAFGVDEPGALGSLQERLAGSMINPITRKLGEAQVPWFRQLTPKGFGATSRISSWIMEYEPRFLSEWNAETTSDRGIARRQILDRYRATLKHVPARPVLGDVIGLTIAVSGAEAARVTELCKAFGYSLTAADAGVTELKGPDFLLRLEPEASAAHGIRRVTFRLRRTPEGRTEFHFGARSVLQLRHNRTATWTF